MGKYSKFKGQLTKVTQEPDYQSKVNFKKDEIKAELLKQEVGISIRTLGMVYASARLEKKRLEALEKAQNLIIAATEQELIEMMESQDFTSVKIDGGMAISIKDDIYCTVKDRPAFLSWIGENDMEDLLSVNYQTMSAMAKGRLIEGEPLPTGIETYFKQGITLRGANISDE
ncbi:MAG TPA: hypothetical protein VGF75_05510 [Candidatus Saccharimonadales bacterium]